MCIMMLAIGKPFLLNKIFNVEVTSSSKYSAKWFTLDQPFFDATAFFMARYHCNRRVSAFKKVVLDLYMVNTDGCNVSFNLLAICGTKANKNDRFLETCHCNKSTRETFSSTPVIPLISNKTVVTLWPYTECQPHHISDDGIFNLLPSFGTLVNPSSFHREVYIISCAAIFHQEITQSTKSFSKQRMSWWNSKYILLKEIYLFGLCEELEKKTSKISFVEEVKREIGEKSIDTTNKTVKYKMAWCQ